MMPRALRFHGPAGRAALVLLVASLLFGGVAAAGPRVMHVLQPSAPALPTDSPVQIQIRSPHGAPVLVNDAGAPMFMELNMRPGGSATNCVTVSNTGPQRADVRFYATSGDQGLAKYVTFVVEAGSGGSFRNCGAFNGTTIFRGPLAEMASEHTNFTTGIGTPAAILVGYSTTFRFTATLTGTPPQGARATASFLWEARAASPTPSELVGQGNPLAGASAGDGVGLVAPSGRAGEGGRSISQLVIHIVGEVAKRGWIWLLLLIAVALFLFIQDRIDRRDPKLAHARVYPDSDLPFESRVASADSETR